tara:strand:- start:3822 stop:4043 length:222 start_codon:yes stop_codon:yes gene_type:complete
MATIKGLYDLIKKEQAEGKSIGVFEQSIIDAFEADKGDNKTKEVDVSFVKNKNENQNTYQSTQDQVEQKKQSE